MSHNPFSARVIQGQFHGDKPAFAVQARPGFGNAAAQPKLAPHVQAAMQHNAPHFQTAQRKAPALQPAAPAQPQVRGNATQVPSSVNLSASGRGQPLPAAVQQKMEAFFGTSFADVRVHVGPQAQQIGAVAFTLGSNLYFAPGQYNPNSQHGQRLIGHELAHVVQQRAGRVRNPFGSGVAVVQDPGLEAEADRVGLRAAQAPMPVQAKPQGPFPPTAKPGFAGRQHTPPGVSQPKAAPPPPGGKPMAAHVQTAVAQAKPAKPRGPAVMAQTGGPPRVIQGKFPGGFSTLSRQFRQTGAIQPKLQGPAMPLPSVPFLAGGGVGQPLPAAVQRKMETFFGTSFSNVRIHTGPQAQQLGALSFTQGSNIYFAPGQYNPQTVQGKRLLAYELTHVVQQRSGQVRNPFGAGVAVVINQWLEREAEKKSRLAALPQRPDEAEPPPPLGPPIIQRMKRPGFTTSAKKSAYNYHNQANRGFTVNPRRPRLRSFNSAMPHRMSWKDIRDNTMKFWDGEDDEDDFVRWTNRFLRAGRGRISRLRRSARRHMEKGDIRRADYASEALKYAKLSQAAFEAARDDFVADPDYSTRKRFLKEANSFHANVPDLGPHGGVNNPVRHRAHLHFPKKKKKSGYRRSPSPMTRQVLRMSPERISDIATDSHGDIIGVHGDTIPVRDLSKRRRRQVKKIGFHPIPSFDPHARFG